MSTRRSFKNIISGIFILLPALSLLFYGYPSMSIYLLIIGFFGIISSILTLISKAGVYTGFVSMTLLMMGLSHLFIAVVSITDQIRLISVISLALILFSTVFYFE